MVNPDISPTEALNAAIQDYNPFSKEGIVKEQDVWGKGFPDVPTLNAHASDTVFQAIEQVRTSQSSQEKVTSIAITAQQGVGKTHIISRIRQHLEREGSAFFIYAGINNYTDLNLVKYQFQQTLADSLSHTVSQGVMQWQKVATIMANEGFKANNPNAANLSPKKLVDRFDKVYASWLSQNKDIMNVLTKQVLKTKSKTDPYIVRAILWTLSETQALFAVKWLSGKELDRSKSEELGLPANSRKTNQDREAEALDIVQEILNLVSCYNPIAICFDEIDVNTNCRDDGLTTPQVIADLVKRLYDTLEQSELSKGIVIITVMMPDTWLNQIELMPGGTPDRVSTYTQKKPVELRYLGSDSIIELVSTWLQEFYNSKNLTPPHSVYPFEGSQLREYGKSKPTVREALRWCAENFKPRIPVIKLPSEPKERFELALVRESKADLGNYIENNSLIADAIRFGFETLQGETLEEETSTGEVLNQVKIQDINDVKPVVKNGGYINFKIIGEEGGNPFKIGVAVLHHSHGLSVGAGMNRLIDYETFDLTRGCLVRSKDKKIKKRWDSFENLNKLVRELGGEWVDLKEENIKPIIDLYVVAQKCDKYQLNKQQVIGFAKKYTVENDLLLEILSNPSGVIDAETIEEEQLLEDLLNTSDPEVTADEDDLSDLFS